MLRARQLLFIVLRKRLVLLDRINEVLRFQHFGDLQRRRELLSHRPFATGYSVCLRNG
jgi:hypothetical protein